MIGVWGFLPLLESPRNKFSLESGTSITEVEKLEGEISFSRRQEGPNQSRGPDYPFFYIMSYFLLPISLCRDIESLVCRF